MNARTLTAAVALLATTVAASVATAAPVPKDLKATPVEHDGVTYRVTFPGKPEVAPTQKGTDTQGEYTKAGACWQASDGRWGVAIVVRESETNFDTAYDADAIAAHFRENAKRMGTVEEERVTAVGSDVVARWFTIKKESGEYVRSLAFVRGNRMYAVVAYGPDAETVTGKEAKAFFDSLVLTK